MFGPSSSWRAARSAPHCPRFKWVETGCGDRVWRAEAELPPATLESWHPAQVRTPWAVLVCGLALVGDCLSWGGRELFVLGEGSLPCPFLYNCSVSGAAVPRWGLCSLGSYLGATCPCALGCWLQLLLRLGAGVCPLSSVPLPSD